MRITLALFTSLILSGCFGPKNGPDETLVVAGPNLTLPPKFELTEPETARVTSSPAEKAANQRLRSAQASLLGTDSTVNQQNSSQISDWLLENQEIQPNIRDQLHTDIEEEAKAEAEKGWLQKLEDSLQRNEE